MSLSMNRLFKVTTIRNLTCVFLGFTFFSSGMAKLYVDHAFIGFIGPVWLEDELSKFDLGVYARFIGYAQVVIGYLLLTLRYSTLGAIMLVPLAGNIFMVTVSLNWTGTPYVLAVLLVMNALVLWTDRKRLLPIVGADSNVVLRGQTTKGILVWLVSVTLVILSISISYLFQPIAYIMVLLGLGLAIWSFRLDRL
ncbi:MAG: hypothetical protein AAFX57_10860 [Bacteroidota bacterium]